MPKKIQESKKVGRKKKKEEFPEEENWRKPESEMDRPEDSLAYQVAMEIQERILNGEKISDYPDILKDL
ncbi:MAG TPA: hypothetical protein PK453_17640 [Leptospiraceae bacterium]|nr:hypothetical protein [Leptospiraceae bacterium]HMY69976.1 hypothetical protein [Leptospiraceae bacterium]HNF15492.1 hypothetical protein [Leptospiraceae bacterium]HNF26302.1 hypothetical protein [Leptospiraceae bacterium]HNH08655.1 hypothetical protein [Leptospiraceae bacterium]